jgi:cytochrome c biogenesis protein CcmG, thiol:disulfide interchange protein DsbE
MSMDIEAPSDTGETVSPDHPAPPRARGRHTARWVGMAVLVIAAGLIAVLATRPSATTVEAQSALVGTKAPAVAGATLDGTHYVLPRAPGHYVVLNFFASWCVPCQVEGPELVAFQFQHQKSGTASVVSVVFQDTTASARAYQAKLGATWPTMADPDNAIALAYGVREDPTSFLIAPNGRVVASIVGGVTAKGLNALVARSEARGYGK